MSLDATLISYVVRRPASFTDLQRHGISADDFADDYRDVWRYLERHKRTRGKVPSRSAVTTRFPDMEWYNTSVGDSEELVDQIRQRRRWTRFLDALDEAATTAGSPENVDDAVAKLSARVNFLANPSGNAHLVDLFDHETAKRMLQEIRSRKFGGALGIPTGLRRFDDLGGMVKGRSYVVGGRTGLGKSWIDLLFVASAVISGHKVILYPLEMTLTETAFRLYTIFSQRMFGAQRVLRNTDLTMGRVTKAKVVRLLHALEDKFAGQLYVADIGALSDPYTVDRIRAEVEIYRPDMFWVDYITLLRAPEMMRGGEDYSAIRYLSSGIKLTALNFDCVGGSSAQINREALKVKSFIPRLEHIMYGDSIGQDADGVAMLNRRGQWLYYGLVKNRHGPEIPTTRCAFQVDEGAIYETEDQGSEDDD